MTHLLTKFLNVGTFNKRNKWFIVYPTIDPLMQPFITYSYLRSNMRVKSDDLIKS